MPPSVASTATVSKPTKDLITYHLRPPAWRLPLLEESESKDAASHETFPGFFPGASALFADWIGNTDNTARTAGHFAGVSRDVSAGQTGVVGSNLAKEDDLCDSLVKSGFVSRTPVQTEAFSAHGLIHQRLRSGASLTALSKIVTRVIERRGGVAFAIKSIGDVDGPREHGAPNPISSNVLPSIGPWTYKAPTKVVYNDARREAWFAELSNPAVPLAKLAKSIPNLPTVSSLPSGPTSPITGLGGSPQSKLKMNESYPANRAASRHLEILLDRQVPPDRANWYLSAVVQADQAQSSKASLRTSTGGNTIGPSSLGLTFAADLSIACIEALNKLLLELTQSLTHGTTLTLNRPAFHVRGRPKNILADETSRQTWQSRWTYVTNLISSGLLNGILDELLLARGIIRLMSDAHMAHLPMVMPLILQIALPCACRDLHSARRLVDCVLSSRTALDKNDDAIIGALPDVDSCVARNCGYVLAEIASYTPEALFRPLQRNSPVGHSVLRDALQKADNRAASDVLRRLDSAGGHTSLTVHHSTSPTPHLCADMPVEIPSDPWRSLSAVLRLLDEHDLQAPLADLVQSIERHVSPMLTATSLVQLLCTYATSDFRFGRHRPFLVGSIVKAMLSSPANSCDPSVTQESPPLAFDHWRVQRGIHLWLEAEAAVSGTRDAQPIVRLLRHLQAVEALDIAALAQFVLPTCQFQKEQANDRDSFFGYIFRSLSAEQLQPGAAFQVARIAALHMNALLSDHDHRHLAAKQDLRFCLRDAGECADGQIVTLLQDLASLEMFDDLMTFIGKLCAPPLILDISGPIMDIFYRYIDIWRAGNYISRWFTCFVSVLGSTDATLPHRSSIYKRLLHCVLRTSRLEEHTQDSPPNAALSAVSMSFQHYKDSITRPFTVPSPDWHADLRNEVTHQILAICLAQDDLITQQLAEHLWQTYGHLSYWIEGVIGCILWVAFQSANNTDVIVLANLTRALDHLTLEDVYQTTSNCLRSEDMITHIKLAPSSSMLVLCALLFELNASHLYGEAGFLADILAPVTAAAMFTAAHRETHERLQAISHSVLTQLAEPQTSSTMMLHNAIDPQPSIEDLLDVLVQWREAQSMYSESDEVMAGATDPLQTLLYTIINSDAFKVSFLRSPTSYCARLLPEDEPKMSRAIAQLDVLDTILEAILGPVTGGNYLTISAMPYGLQTSMIDMTRGIPWFLELKQYNIEARLRRFNLDPNGQAAGAGYVRGLLHDLCDDAENTSCSEIYHLAAFTGPAAVQLIHAAFERMTESLAELSRPSAKTQLLQRMCDICRRVLNVNTTFEANSELCLLLSGPFLSSWTLAVRETADAKSELGLTGVLEMICLAIRLHSQIWFEQQAALTETALLIVQLVFSGAVNGPTACSMADVAILLVDCALDSTDLSHLQTACTNFKHSTFEATHAQRRLLSLFPSESIPPGGTFLRTAQGDFFQPSAKWCTAQLTGQPEEARRNLAASNNAAIDLASVGTRILDLNTFPPAFASQRTADVQASNFDSETPSTKESVWMRDYRRSVTVSLEYNFNAAAGGDLAALKGTEGMEAQSEQLGSGVAIPAVKIEDTQADLLSTAAASVKKTQLKKRKSTPGIAAEDASPKRRKVSSKTTSKRKP